MDQESIVYGCIKDGCTNVDLERRRTNRLAMRSLPKADAWPFLCQEMFAVPSHIPGQGNYQTEVMHFGASYKAVEYEWAEWIGKFEELLKGMYWNSAVVHLETEMSGIHSFFWESTSGFHAPNSGDMKVRCEWIREQGLAS